MRRFLVKGALEENTRIVLSPEESRHAIKALRLSEGAIITLFNGAGAEAEGRLSGSDPDGASVEVGKVRWVNRAVHLALLQAPLKGPKMDWLVEKVTEMGVSSLLLAQTKNTVASGEKIDRWERISQAASKQSGNSLLPEIHGAKPLHAILDQLSLDGTLALLLQPGAPEGLAELVRRKKNKAYEKILLAVGPEGGFTSEEESAMVQKGFVPVCLSRQVLRGETAAIAALAIAAHSIDF